MGLPIIELIAENMLSTIAGITEAAGYNYNLTAQRHSRAGDKRVHLNAVIIQEDPRAVSESENCNTTERLVTFGVGVFVIPPEDDLTPIDTYCNLVAADVERAVMKDRYRGGNALDTNCKPYNVVIEDGSEYDLVVLQIEINYRTSELDPRIRA